MPTPPIAGRDDWYRVQRLSDGVTLIFEHHIVPFYRCNIWHVRGRDRDLLVDSGMGVVSLVGAVPWLAERPLVALASHTHFDHIGNHHEFAERACHRLEAPILADPAPAATLAERYAVIEMFDALPPGGYRQADYRVEAAPATRVLEDGDVIDLGDRVFEVVHVPGHSPGSIALWEAATSTLFSGDAVYDGPLIDDAYHSNRDDYVVSMQRLRRLPVRVVHGGHFPSFGRERYLQLIDDYLAGKRSPGCPPVTSA
ncbi:MBL fold metallo-hydrolase [Crenobacter cavernae]|uniref:MBL fold metallo-hydrolase n=1 Tax=Crenobacter cavernae TaxID=2290923 RepID=A0ABY0F9B0_9NEIS|nr:MBL fold metallo-hydrolase [Crenobacter cavernae]RXZ42067.1 MBL fold metallo-hydrolase [Crenobacter cavernae]